MIVNRRRERRRFHVRNRVRGTADRPRLSVHRSLKQISCQVIDDIAGKTLVSVSTLDKEMRERSDGWWQQRLGGHRWQGDCRKGAPGGYQGSPF